MLFDLVCFLGLLWRCWISGLSSHDGRFEETLRCRIGVAHLRFSCFDFMSLISVDSTASNCKKHVRPCSLYCIYRHTLSHRRGKMFADGWTWWSDIGQLLRNNVTEEPQRLQLDIGL